jgi:hypothetical protein
VQDPPISAEAANFDAFLDTHHEIDAQLRTNPLLINDQKWLSHHREVLVYFDRHPEAKNEVAASPSYFIRREGRRAAREEQRQNENLRKDEIANFQQFLNFNPGIGKQLTADPSLVKESSYLDEHPGLQAYLYDHPQVNKDLREDPGLFFQRDTQQNNPAKNGTEDQKAQGQEKQVDSPTPTHQLRASKSRTISDKLSIARMCAVRPSSTWSGQLARNRIRQTAKSSSLTGSSTDTLR